MDSADNEIVSYNEMCRREGLSLQRGMNFGLAARPSIILMSQRRGAPYTDQIRDDGRTLIYEGHDVPRTAGTESPKNVDQQDQLPSGKLTENGKFKKAVEEAKKYQRAPERVRVYEKIRDGIWSYNGIFDLTDCWTEQSNNRQVFKFKLVVVDDNSINPNQPIELVHRRIIPTDVKLRVWQRDGGKCVLCHAADNLHFDHVIPYSKGGSSLTAENVQLLCVRHNLSKHDKII